MIDFFASHTAYAQHLLPVFFATPPEHRGYFYAVLAGETAVRDEVGRKLRRGAPINAGPVVVVASYQDYRQALSAGRQVVLLNHGAGQSYEGKLRRHPSYSGGTGRGKVALFLEPGPYAGELTRAQGGNVAEIGVPKLDVIHTFPAEPEDAIAVSFHWHLPQLPETDWAWPEFKEIIAKLAQQRKVLGHAHPRAWARLQPWYESVGIEPVKSFDEVLQRARIYVADNTSTLYEFASTGRPVVVLNSKHYRRDVHHGLRFWDLIPGIQVDEPAELIAAIGEAEAGDYDFRDTIEKVYRYCDGQAAKRAVQAVLEMGDQQMAQPGDPYRPTRSGTTPPPPKPTPPQFPLTRLRRVGASTAEIEAARAVWDSMGSEEEQEAAAAEFAEMSDVELRDTLREQEDTPDLNAMTIPQVLDWVGNSKRRAQVALDVERAKEDAAEGKGRKTLIAALKRVLNG